MTINIDPGVRATPEPQRPGRSRARLVAMAAGVVLAIAVVTLVCTQVIPSTASAGTRGAEKALVQTNCQAKPSACGFPDATNSGVPASVKLRTVPGQVSSGLGWTSSASGSVQVRGNGAVLSGLYIPGNLDILASHVTIKDVKVVTGGAFGISLRHTAGVTIENSTISGRNVTSGRVDSAIADLYGDSTGIVIKANNISAFRSAVQVTTGLVTGNYMHHPGYISGDHTNGVIADGGSGRLQVTHNTILNSLGQTDAVTIDTSQTAGPVRNKVIMHNLLAGGGYPIYGGTAFGHATAGILIENNRFGQGFYRSSGQFGPVAYFDSAGSGNVWTGNVWDSTGATIPAP
jgi:Right handed beta helix region